MSQFDAEVASTDWSTVISSENPDHILDKFYRKLEEIRKKYTTICKTHIRQHTLPWVNTEILQLLKNRDSALEKYRASKTPEDKLIFTKLRNKCNFELRNAKQKYYEKQITIGAANPKKLWLVMKSVNGERNTHNTRSLQILVNGTLLTDQDKIANLFNNYFIQSVQDLSSQFAPPEGLPAVSHCIPTGFSFSEIAQNNLINTLLSLNLSHARDQNYLDMKFLKTDAQSLMPFLHHIVNLCIRLSKFLLENISNYSNF